MTDPTHTEMLAELQRLARSRIERRKRLNFQVSADACFAEREALDQLAALPLIKLPDPILVFGPGQAKQCRRSSIAVCSSMECLRLQECQYGEG